MYSISKKISLGKQVSVEKTTFSNDEIGRSAVVRFTCDKCNYENEIEITPYESGFPILQLYNEDKVISKNELLKKGAVTETLKSMQHFGEITVNNLPTLYFGTDCPSCHSKYVCIFSYGEKQPGLTLLTISGVWKYEELK